MVPGNGIEVCPGQHLIWQTVSENISIEQHLQVITGDHIQESKITDWK
jgi:hypothetical protein